MSFYSNISDYYDDIFPLNKSQLTFVTNSIDEHNNYKNMLDIGCGTGGLPIGLYSYFDVISAVDTNVEMLKIAKHKAKEKKINFITAGMLDIDTKFSNNSFDIVLCFGNTVAHLQTIADVELFFDKVKHLLTEGGKFLFQVINYDNVLNNSILGLPIIENEIVKFERYYNVDTNNMLDFSTILTIKKTGEVINNNIKLLPIRKVQIEQALTNVGFETVKSFSSFAKSEYKHDSLPLVFECY